MKLADIREQCGVPAWRGDRVQYTTLEGETHTGTICGAASPNIPESVWLHVNLPTWIGTFHVSPAKLTYLDADKRAKGKQTTNKEQAK